MKQKIDKKSAAVKAVLPVFVIIAMIMTTVWAAPISVAYAADNTKTITGDGYTATVTTSGESFDESSFSYNIDIKAASNANDKTVLGYEKKNGGKLWKGKVKKLTVKKSKYKHLDNAVNAYIKKLVKKGTYGTIKVRAKAYKGVKFTNKGLNAKGARVKWTDIVGSKWSPGPYQNIDIKIKLSKKGKVKSASGEKKGGPGGGNCGNTVPINAKSPKLTWKNVIIVKDYTKISSSYTATVESKIKAVIDGDAKASCPGGHVSAKASFRAEAWGSYKHSFSITASSKVEAQKKAETEAKKINLKAKAKAAVKGKAEGNLMTKASGWASITIKCSNDNPAPPAPPTPPVPPVPPVPPTPPTPTPDRTPTVSVGDLECLHLLDNGDIEIIAYDSDGDTIAVKSIQMSDHGTYKGPKMQSSEILSDGSRRTVWKMNVTAVQLGTCTFSVTVEANGKTATSMVSSISVIENEGEAVWGDPNLD